MKLKLFQVFRSLHPIRSYSSISFTTTEEKHIYNKLKQFFHGPKEELYVEDISGGCGSMFKIIVQSTKFNGLSTMKQHKLVNSVLSEDIKKWHGLQLTTKKISST